MKKLAVAVAFLAIAGVLFAQDAPKAEKPEVAAPAAVTEVKAAPAAEVKAASAVEDEFCAKVVVVEGKETFPKKCHKKGCKFYSKRNTKCFPTADAAKAAGVTAFCKQCCKDQQ